MRPLISVLMSVYNESELFIRESVSSILDQTFKDFELIVINDNPKRNDVEDILMSYNDDRIIYYQNPNNIGLALSMNKAAEIAKADIFARMDSDDVAISTRLEIEYNALENNKCDFVFSAYSSMNERGEYLANHINYSLQTSSSIRKKVAIKPSLIHHPTTMFTRQIFEKVGGYRNFPCAQDADIWMRMAECGCRFNYIPVILLKYRLASTSVTRTKWFKQQLIISYIYRLSFERMVKGKDDFSVDHLNHYLDVHGINDKGAEINMRNAYDKLRKALKNKGVISLLTRIYVFYICPELRNNYMISFYKKMKLNF